MTKIIELKNLTNSTLSEKIKILQSCRDNLPEEIKISKRFFEVNADKSPRIKDWNNPENQKYLQDVQTPFVGFDTTGHGLADDYLFCDFDHVLTADRECVNSQVEDFLKELYGKFPNIYIEKSISGTGLHCFFKPTTNNFKSMSAGKNATLYFDDLHGNDSPKLEIFYGSKGRYALVTGLKVSKGIEIPSDHSAGAYIERIIARIKAQTPPQTITVDKPANNFHNRADYDDPPEYVRDLAIALLDDIDPATLLRDSDWLSVISSCKNCGVPENITDDWNKRDTGLNGNGKPRYNDSKNQGRYDSITDSSYGIENLIGKAPHFNISAFKAQWYKDHPKFSKKKFQSDLRDVNKKFAEFDNEKLVAVETLKSVKDFKKENVFTDEIINAAALCKLYNPQIYSDFKVKIQNQIKSQGSEKFILDWLATVKSKADELTKFYSDLKTNQNKIQSAITTQNFFAQNSIENFSMENFTIPENYSISDNGIYKADGEKMRPVCNRPVVLAEKIVYPTVKSDEILFSDETKFKFALAHKLDGKFYKIKATEASAIFDARNLVKLRDFDVPVSSANSRNVIEFLDNFSADNDLKLPKKYCLLRCGWYEYQNYWLFIDPRKKFSNSADVDYLRDKIFIDDKNQTAKDFTMKGSIENFKIIYNEVVIKSPLARFILALSVAVPLLKICGCRNFTVYLYGTTTSGKTTAMKLASSLVGNPQKLIKSYDSTEKSFTQLAYEFSDYPLYIDEKQLADQKLQDNLIKTVYSFGNGQGRQRLKRDGSLRDNFSFRTITFCNGETELLSDNATGGAYTRLLQIQLKDKIFNKDDCEKIWRYIENNYGFILPLVIEQYLREGFDELRGFYDKYRKEITDKHREILPEHCEFLAISAIADIMLNKVLGVNESQAMSAARKNVEEIFKLIPTRADISDANRESNCVIGFIAENKKYFIKSNKAKQNSDSSPTDIVDYEPNKILGKISQDYIYITQRALKQCCSDSGFSYNKLIADLIAVEFFKPADNTEKNRTKKRSDVVTNISGLKTRCLRIPTNLISTIEND
jgi:hypothetical protein